MNQIADGVSPVSKRPLWLTVRMSLLALLALGAVLLSVLAMHSAASEHVMGIPLPVSSTLTAHANTASMEHASSEAAPAGQQLTGAVVSVVSATQLTGYAVATIAAGRNGMLDCGLMVMGCVMLLVLAAVALLFRRASGYQCRLMAHNSVISQSSAVDAPAPWPSLTLLCINRV
jgi:hypothetical protein